MQMFRQLRNSEVAAALIGTRGFLTSSFVRGEKGNALFESVADVQPIVDPQEAAESAGLRYVSDVRPGIPCRNSRNVFTYPQAITSSDVNEYLKAITGADISARDFRTWAWTVLTALALSELPSFESATQAKHNLRNAIKDVAARLGNTPTICRKCYVHLQLVTSYLDGNFALKVKPENKLRGERSGLKPEEAAVLATLRSRLGHENSSRVSTAA
jgi:hypothetical protein